VSSRLRPGDVVEVRPAAEILGSLDDDSATAGLPFMPEMARFVGSRFTVSAVARKVCDTSSDGTGNRLFDDTVFLDDLRCDGSAHGGCQAGCRLMWRTSWLRPVSEDAPISDGDTGRRDLDLRAGAATTRTRDVDGQTTDVYRCQATELVAASRPIPPEDRIRKYTGEIRCGNVGIFRFVRVLARAVSRKAGRMLRLRKEVPVSSPGPPGPTPTLGLQPGELVQVKSKREIAAAVDELGRNKGLSFDWEMVPHCGRVHRVQDRVERIIDENTGAMIHLKSDCLILEGVVCSGDLSEGRWFCPRAIYPYWREAWLRRVGDGPNGND